MKHLLDLYMNSVLCVCVSVITLTGETDVASGLQDAWASLNREGCEGCRTCLRSLCVQDTLFVLYCI